jgi:hypothetical protein
MFARLCSGFISVLLRQVDVLQRPAWHGIPDLCAVLSQKEDEACSLFQGA